LESVINARNKLKTIDLMGIDTHIVYHAQRIITEWGWGLSKTDGSWGSKGSCHSDLASRAASFKKQKVVHVDLTVLSIFQKAVTFDHKFSC